MAFKFNVFTGTLDVVNPTSSGSGSVSGVSPTLPKSITRWVDTMGTVIEDSKTILQDGGAIEAQGFITRRAITDNVKINSGQSWIAPSLELELSGSIELEPDGEIIVV